MKLLLVEDDNNITKLLKKAFKNDGYFLDTARNGKDGLDMAMKSNYNAIILDIMLPYMDGMSVLKEIRRQQHNTPVLLLTARGEVQDKVDGLEAGADDYLAKPFDYMELSARIKALLRRSNIENPNHLIFENLTLDTVSHQAAKNGKDIVLTQIEYALMELLVRNLGKPINRQEITKYVWKQNYISDSNVIDVYIKRLRQKIGERKNGESFIKSVRGLGYMVGEAIDE